MSTILRYLVFVCLCLGVAAAESWLPADCHQFLLVVTPDWDASAGTLQRYERGDSPWRPVGAAIPVRVGRNGLAWGRGERSGNGGPVKREGDGKGPAGIFRILSLWTRDGIQTPDESFPPHRIYADTQGVDDPGSRYYNRIVRRGEVPDPDWTSFEKMDIPDYDRVLVVSHNFENPRPGAGSCIFIHRWENRRTATAGCTVMSEEKLAEVIAWLRPEAQPTLVQLPQTEYERWLAAGRLPKPVER